MATASTVSATSSAGAVRTVSGKSFLTSGEVFDILGQLTFDNHLLPDLLVEAVRYGDQPEVRARLTRVVDEALDRDHLPSWLSRHWAKAVVLG